LVIFKFLKWRNFLSTGNNWTEIDLTETKSTLIVGQNGAGKSTMLDAISFALFGKPHRNINKPNLVNSINNKDCVVEVVFSIGKSDFKVVRGIKPQIFEIWKNGKLINQDSHSKEYQKVLEQNILKLTHKSFHQIVVLGSSSFIPFMQLTTQNRREVIEDLLDINIFSKMNILIKEKNTNLRDYIREIGHKIEMLQERIEAQTKYIRDIDAMNVEEIEAKNRQILGLQREIESLQEKNVIASEYIEAHREKAEIALKQTHDKKQQILHYRAQFGASIKDVVNSAKFYEEHENCPTCSQIIAPEIRTINLNKAKSKAAELQSAMRKADDEGRKTDEMITKLTRSIDVIREHQSDINANNQSIKRIQSNIGTINEDITRLATRADDLDGTRQDLESLKAERETLREEKFKSNEEYTYNTSIAEMLKDTGIKTKVIKQYVPVINKLVNQYLQILDFFVHFNLDEEFNETVRSRHRDNFTYDSFSEGEKQRIDLSLLFTWRMIAKMKNSVATNLLILDETFDSSLDADGVDNLMKILYTLGDDTNVFVISHKGEILDGKFNRKLEFVKEKNFSKIAT